MKLITLIILTLCSLNSCLTVQQVNLKTGVGNELREGEPMDHRFSAHLGPEIQFQNGVKTEMVYRHRITDFEPDSLEHGIFVNACIPIWKKK